MTAKQVIERFLKNDVIFLDYVSPIEMYGLLNQLRMYSQRLEALSICFEKLSLNYPEYAFLLVYDINDYENYCRSFLNKDFSVLFNLSFFHDFIFMGGWRIKYVMENYESLIIANKDIMFSIIKYGLEKNEEQLLKKVLYCKNMNIRGLAMYELIDNFPYAFLKYYSNVKNFMAIYSENGLVVSKIPEEYASRVAFLIIDQGLGKDLFEEVKGFIFDNYDSNILASLLAGKNGFFGIEPSYHMDILEEDMTRYFLTSKNYKYELYKIGKEFIDEDVYQHFESRIKRFTLMDEEIIERIFSVGLGDKFLDYVDECLERSTGTKVVSMLQRGSSTRPFRVGDYVVKCSFKKWDFLEYPQEYLFAKNYGCEYVRGEMGSIVGAIEVQDYYTRAVTLDEKDLIDKFMKALEELGYEIKDNVIGFGGTSNLFHLGSYKDANIGNPEELPDWFKKEPVVWIDIDLIYKKK